jgi:hypothetical protein
MTACRFVDVYRHFGGMRCLHHQNSNIFDPDDRGNKFLGNVGKPIPNSAALVPQDINENLEVRAAGRVSGGSVVECARVCI